MTTALKFLAMGFLISSTTLANAQYSNNFLYSELASLDEMENTTSAKLIKQVDKVQKLTQELAVAEEKKERAIRRKIEHGQERIIELNDLLSAQSAMASNYLNFSKYNFDVADKSLLTRNFEVGRNGDTQNFDISFETDRSGKARIDIISPGGELLKSVFISNYSGKTRKQIDLSSEKGQVYFIHIDVDGKAITKKVRFS